MKKEKETGAHVLIAILFMFAVVFLLTRCSAVGSPKVCVTRCGLSVVEPFPPQDATNRGQPQWSCAELQRAEDASLAAYAAHVTSKDPRFALACDALRGFTLNVHKDPRWYSYTHGFDVTGVTYCFEGAIWIGNVPPMRSSITHELAHAIQRCTPAGPPDNADPMHSNWVRDGIFEAEIQVHTIGNAEAARCFRAGSYVGPLDGGVCQ